MLTQFPGPMELKGAVQGTCLYLGLYFCGFIGFQSFSKFYLMKQKKAQAKMEGKRIRFVEVKYYNRDDKLALCGDRTVGNFLEMGFLFLPLFWIHALFVDPSQSFTIAALYTFTRALYPFVFWSAKIPLLLCSTVPGYLIYAYLLLSVAHSTLL